MIRVCVVEDQTLVRQGIVGLLELVAGVEVVAEAGDAEAALRAIAQARPDVVLLDIRLPGRSGLDVLRELRRTAEPPAVLVLTTFDDDATVLDSLREGAKGFLLKDVTLEQLAGAIRTVAAGGSLVQPAVTERLLRGLEGLRCGFPSLDPPDPLTGREKEILRLLAGGYSNREIAGALRLAPGTVKNHISSILSKIGVRDRTRAVLKALELGLI